MGMSTLMGRIIPIAHAKLTPMPDERSLHVNLVDRTKTVPKSMAKVCILEILADASEQKPLSQEMIRELLSSTYRIELDRKTLREQIRDIVSCVERVRYTEKTRIVKGEESSVMTDFWLDPDEQFDESELKALIYTVIFAKHIPVKYKEDLVEKLESLTSSDIHRQMGNYILRDNNTVDDYNQLFYNISMLSEAIEEQKKMSFRYTHYEVGKSKLQVSEQVYTVSPLGIGSSEGDFYLIATLNGVQNDSVDSMQAHFEAVVEAMEKGQVRIDTFRLDRIHDVQKLDEDREAIDGKKALRLKGARWNKLDVQEYMRENPSLESGHSVLAKFRVHEDAHCAISDIIDYFGKANVKINKETSDGTDIMNTYVVTVRTNDGSLRDFALRNAPCVEVLKPESIRTELAEIHRLTLERMSS